MDFGILEIANSKATAAPGWAYVPDTGVGVSAPAVTALQPGRAKRARNLTLATAGDTTAKQDAKLLRGLEELTRESHREVQIPIAGRANQKGTTPAVRKILASNKTFNNHLDDYTSLKELAPPPPSTPQPIVVSPPPVSTPGTPLVKPAPHLTSKGTRSHKKKDPSQLLRPPPGTVRKLPIPPITPIAPNPQEIKPLITLPILPPPPSHPGDSDPLLQSRIPRMPTQEEINNLVSAPPLSYEETRGRLNEEERPVRLFCEVCGYWGRVRCVRCGGRVCALECLDVHREECFSRYGA
ncbi:hypothetical protein HYALB_00010334 [Hymenoscyphus albidus]|uniref:HIT-type domain-containing protein n=1 Tax=Hymenoscyphus albidus TaxID=595503 RepID=A0A9N9Q629_9HELO|nr:hypothetical protein HYALB_00010334 [Hymenoscyphus albidus]